MQWLNPTQSTRHPGRAALRLHRWILDVGGLDFDM
jgi:hypothetical protein